MRRALERDEGAIEAWKRRCDRAEPRCVLWAACG
ncbi:hypothetical protein ACIODT_39135 [Streptomyces sp. NPDC088251]